MAHAGHPQEYKPDGGKGHPEALCCHEANGQNVESQSVPETITLAALPESANFMPINRQVADARRVRFVPSCSYTCSYEDIGVYLLCHLPGRIQTRAGSPYSTTRAYPSTE